MHVAMYQGVMDVYVVMLEVPVSMPNVIGGMCVNTRYQRPYIRETMHSALNL